MKDIAYCIGLLIFVGLIVGHVMSHRPDIRHNEANGKTDVHRFKGYKQSLDTIINQGVPVYGEQKTGFATGIYHTDQGA